MLQELRPFNPRAEPQTQEQKDPQGLGAAPGGTPDPLKVIKGHGTTTGSLGLDMKDTER